MVTAGRSGVRQKEYGDDGTGRHQTDGGPEHGTAATAMGACGAGRAREGAALGGTQGVGAQRGAALLDAWVREWCGVGAVPMRGALLGDRLGADK